MAAATEREWRDVAQMTPAERQHLESFQSGDDGPLQAGQVDPTQTQVPQRPPLRRKAPQGQRGARVVQLQVLQTSKSVERVWIDAFERVVGEVESSKSPGRRQGCGRQLVDTVVLRVQTFQTCQVGEQRADAGEVVERDDEVNKCVTGTRQSGSVAVVQVALGYDEST